MNDKANLLDAMNLRGEYKALDTAAPDPIRQTITSTAMEAVVDVKPQELVSIKPFAAACLNISPLMEKESQIVLQALFSCFEQQKSVKEGLIGDMMWGFEQVGIPAQLTWKGLRQLERLGYVKFQTKDNAMISAESDLIGSAFLRYERKLLEMVCESAR